MDPTRWAKISEIIGKALEKPAAERGAYAREACGEDTAMRAEIESLLSFGDGAGPDIFENVQIGKLFFTDDERTANGLIGKRIGKYQLTALLGEGGMGAVFLAERTDGEFEQQVAVKLLKHGFISPVALNRFISERRILARLHHRFIAQLLDGGTTDEGLPYLVMEYIEGLPLPEYCRKHQLDLQPRLEIFRKICSAVQYAHQHLVIHRDLKPANILITEDGAPKLLDFGISKLVSPDGGAPQTQTQFRALTPAYASPEQIKGEPITTAGDVYSLGIILYELLTGRRPYETDSQNFSDIIRAICETEPLRPSAVGLRSQVSGLRTQVSSSGSQVSDRQSDQQTARNKGQKTNDEDRNDPKSEIRNPKSLRGDLDNIVLTALRKEPARRYQTVEELSRDISNYLNGLPVNARPQTFFYRLSKFYARNRTASVIGLLLVLSLFAGIIATTRQAVIARRERDRAEKRFQDVRQLSNSLLFEITPKMERLPGSTEAREVVVKRALEYLDNLSNEAQEDPNLQSELASAYEKVGDVQGNPQKPNLGDLQGGIESYQKAQRIRIRLAETNPQDAEFQRLLAANYNSIGDFRWWASDVAGTLVDYEKAIGVLEPLIAKNPDRLPLQLDLLNSLGNKIKVISYNGNYNESLRMYEDLLQRVAELETAFGPGTELQRIKASTLMRTAYDLSWQNRYDILDDFVKRSLALFEPLAAANPNDLRLQRDLYYAYFQAGGIYIEVNNPLSRQYLEKSAEIARQRVENDKIDYLAKFDSAQSYSKIGEVLSVEKKYVEAIVHLNLAGGILEEISAAEPRHEGYKYSLANNYARLAAALEGLGQFPDAVKNYLNCIDQQEKLYRGDDKNNMPLRAIAVARQDLGRVYEKLGEREKALDSYQKSVEMFALLEQKDALGEYDRRNFQSSRTAVERLRIR